MKLSEIIKDWKENITDITKLRACTISETFTTLTQLDQATGELLKMQIEENQEGYNEMQYYNRAIDDCIPIVAKLQMENEELKEHKRLHNGIMEALDECTNDNVELTQDLAKANETIAELTLEYKGDNMAEIFRLRSEVSKLKDGK